MHAITVTLRDGTAASLFQEAAGSWICPVCGSAELTQAPYFGDGASSFEMCSCGFEFGFDDDPGASRDAVESVQENWALWRRRYVSELRSHPRALAEMVARLNAIGVVTVQSWC